MGGVTAARFGTYQRLTPLTPTSTIPNGQGIRILLSTPHRCRRRPLSLVRHSRELGHNVMGSAFFGPSHSAYCFFTFRLRRRRRCCCCPSKIQGGILLQGAAVRWYLDSSCSFSLSTWCHKRTTKKSCYRIMWCYR